MQKLLTLLALIPSLNTLAQPIEIVRDTVLVLQNSDAGVVAHADIDSDGDQDILITGSPGITTIYVNDGNGVFTATNQPNVVEVFSGAAKFADVDGDGDMDLMMNGSTSAPLPTANLYLNDGLGNFSVSTSTTFTACTAGDLSFGDVDGDNDEDLVITGIDASGNSIATLYINDGSGSFSTSNVNLQPLKISSVEFFDMDNDNDLDLIMAGVDDNDDPHTDLYENDGQGNLSLVSNSTIAAIGGDIALGDTDNDGDIDVILTGANDTGGVSTHHYINNAGTFSLLSNAIFPGSQFHSCSLNDLNNDGLLDFLLLGVTTNGVIIGHIYQNLGSNAFVLADTTLAPSYNGNHVCADFNGDNKLDIITTGTSFTAPFRAPKIYHNQSPLDIEQILSPKTAITIYPNPSDGEFMIEMEEITSGFLEVYDLNGRLIYSKSFEGRQISTTLNKQSGLYLVRVVTKSELVQEKIRIF